MVERRTPKRPVGITLIAVGKLVKVAVLIALGVFALTLVGKDPPAELLHWANVLRVDRDNRVLHRVLQAVSGVGTHKLEEVSVGTFVYAVVFAVEGAGLWFQKAWAEYLTLAVTTSFIPLEIYEITREARWGRIAMLVLNVAVVIYLALRVRQRRRV